MKTKYILTIAFAVSAFAVFCSSANAATIFTDDFEDYNVGLLGGQGGWVVPSYYMYRPQVQSSYVKQGEKAIKVYGDYLFPHGAEKTGTPTNDGMITIYLEKFIGGTSTPDSIIELKEGGTVVVSMRSVDSHFRYFDGNLGGYVNIYPPFFYYKTWFAVQIQWRSSDHKIRYNIDGGAWTDWKTGMNEWATGLDTVALKAQDGWIYYDAIQENLILDKNPVLIVPGLLGSAQKDGQWMIDPILHTYDNLFDTLELNEYVQDETLFTFPYNWRQSNIDTAIQLQEKINQIKDICNCDKIDLVTHSMGGLVARQYIESSDYQDDIDDLIFLGTPHLGAPKDYLMWEAGELDKGISDQILHFLLTREAKKQEFSNLFDYIRNKPIPSVQELLPIYNYLVDANPLSVRHYPENYPTNSFLENLDDNLSLLTESDVKIFNIIGELQDNSTINYIRVVSSTQPPLWEHGYPEGFDEQEGDRGLILGVGDGTVPTQSSDIFPDSLSIDVDHRSLPTNAELQVLNDLLGPGQYETVDDPHFFDIKLLIIKLLSPVDMQVVAPDGKRIGKDFESGQIINEIPYAFYSGFQTDDEYITIINPVDGEYEVVAQGTDNGGEYTLSTALISNDQALEQDFQAYITGGQIEGLNINLSADDGTIDISPEDTTPPEIVITSPGNTDYLHSESFDINYSVSDSESGVFSSLAKLDNINVENGESIDLFFQALGNHEFIVEAQDNVNNEISQTVQFRLIATIDSTISDISRAFSLGWIEKEQVKDNLIKDLNTATKILEKNEMAEDKLSLDILFCRLLLIKLEVLKDTGKINQQAYDVISADINWLINNN